VNGRAKQVDVCTRCLRSGKVEKAARGMKPVATPA
jgi:ribosomal protein L28